MHTTRYNDVSFTYDGDYEGIIHLYGEMTTGDTHLVDDKLNTQVSVSFESLEKFIIQKYTSHRIAEAENLENLLYDDISVEADMMSDSDWERVYNYISRLEQFEGSLCDLFGLIKERPLS